MNDISEIIKLLIEAAHVYNKDESNFPIKKTDYLVLLDTFEKLVSTIEIPDEYDTDFRRNLPAGSFRGYDSAPSIAERINDVRSLLQFNEIYSLAGKELIENIRVCLDLAADHVDVSEILNSAIPVLKTISAN